MLESAYDFVDSNLIWDKSHIMNHYKVVADHSNAISYLERNQSITH